MSDSFTPNGIILYAERKSDTWRLCGIPLSDNKDKQPIVLLENITDASRHIAISKNRANIVAVAQEGEQYAIYIIRARDGWKPIKIVNDCRQWLGTLDIFYVADDGAMIGHIAAGQCSIALESEGWTRRQIDATSPKGYDADFQYRILDDGRTITQGQGTGILVWAASHNWEPDFINLVPSQMELVHPRTGINHNYVVGSGAQVILGAKFARKKKFLGIGHSKEKYALFLLDRASGQVSPTLVWESDDEIDLHSAAISENNDCGLLVVNKNNILCSFYGVRRETGWKPELALASYGLVQPAPYRSWTKKSPFIVAITQHDKPGHSDYYFALYSIDLQDKAWLNHILFSRVESGGESGALYRVVDVAPDRHCIAAIVFTGSGDTYGSVLRCAMNPEGKTINEWPASYHSCVQFSPDGQWLSYLAENENSLPTRMVRRVYGSEEYKVYLSEPWGDNKGSKVYIGWVIPASQLRVVSDAQYMMKRRAKRQNREHAPADLGTYSISTHAGSARSALDRAAAKHQASATRDKHRRFRWKPFTICALKLRNWTTAATINTWAPAQTCLT